MKRKQFIKSIATAGIALSAFPTVIVKSSSNNSMDRIGLTTVVFRDRFKSTRPKGRELNDELVLKVIPEYFADQFGIHNVEIWSRHFESTDKTYLEEFRKSLRKSKSRLIDIQVDTKYDLSDTDEEKRHMAVKEMKDWIDVGSQLETGFIRISPMKKSYEKGVESIKEIVDYAKQRGIMALIENHNDMFSNVDNHLKIKKDIIDNEFGLLADFGNYPSDTDQHDALKQIAPFTKLISAKTKDFDDSMNHISYDFGKCIRIFEEAGYKGVYSLEQWGKPNSGYDYEKITDWMIEQTLKNIM